MSDLDNQVERAARQVADLAAQVLAWRDAQNPASQVWGDFDTAQVRLQAASARLLKASYRLKVQEQEQRITAAQQALADLNTALGGLP